jgi:methylthioribose-1-phosphate isomerase
VQDFTSRVQAIRWQNDRLLLLDQRLLPAEERYLELSTAPEVAEAIHNMTVRGAPAIGIAAAYAVVLSAAQHLANGKQGQAALQRDIEVLRASRPTAINLHWALARMLQVLAAGPADLVAALQAEAVRIHREDREANYRMAELGAALLPQDAVVLTHCNTGALATGGYGTALGVIRKAHADKKLKQVYATETRPWLQGARLTAWELEQDRIPVSLLVEGAAASLMQTLKVDWVIVGADRIAANGDVANKIGTYALAVAAKYHGVKVMVVAPSSTFDLQTASAAGIPIEHRAVEEITRIISPAQGYKNVGGWNPVFDVTPAGLIDAIVSERGIVHAPLAGRLAAIAG